VAAADSDPMQVAVRALRHRDLSTAALDARLERAGVDAESRQDALDELARVGYVDDGRFAARRAHVLSDRGWGDAGIDADLRKQGLDADTREAALAELEPERNRARRIVDERGPGQRTAAYLTRRGFGFDAVEQAAVAEEA
jgi:regulatory protein